MPLPDSYLVVKHMPEATNEMLRYCIGEVLERAGDGTMRYSSEHDEMTYHLVLNDTDRELFMSLKGSDEIWITTKGRRES